MTGLRAVAAPAEPDADAVAAAMVALAGLPALGAASLLRCRRAPGGAPAALALLRRGRSGEIRAFLHPARLTDPSVEALVAAARAADGERALRRHRERGIAVLVEGSDTYPERLAADPAPPAVLFARGELAGLDAPTAAIVGTRNATTLGRDLAAELGADLAAAGVAVVSGLARGIDAAAHRGALGVAAPAAPVIGVVATGLDIAYPRAHAALHREVAERGLLLSEWPLGVPPARWRFPARNRILAGLADVVVVVESRLAGGSMSTVAEALQRGLSVLAVPGHPRAPASAGTNDLLFDGAGVVRSADDVLGALGLDPRAAVPAPAAVGAPSASVGHGDAETSDEDRFEDGPVAVAERASSRRKVDVGEPALGADAAAVLAALGWQPASLGELVTRSGCGLERTATALADLEAVGAVQRTAGWFERATSEGPGR